MENKASVLRKQSRRIRFLWKSWWLGEEVQRSLQLRKMFSLKNPLVFLKGAAIPVLCMLCYLSRPEQGSHDRPLSSTQMTALYCQRWMSLTAHHIIPGISITCSIASRRLSSAILNKNAIFVFSKQSKNAMPVFLGFLWAPEVNWAFTAKQVRCTKLWWHSSFKKKSKYQKYNNLT